jgi:hypothetical protein
VRALTIDREKNPQNFPRKEKPVVRNFPHSFVFTRVESAFKSATYRVLKINFSQSKRYIFVKENPSFHFSFCFV